MNELVSVIIPVYNGEKFVARCIDSILAQTYKNNEIIIVDDGSVDNTLSILQEYEKLYSFVRVVHTENKGVSHARNIGLDIAKGEYISFVDADDELCTDALERLYQLLNDYGADISCGFGVDISAAGERTDHKDTNQLLLWEGDEILRQIFDEHFVSYGAIPKLYKRELLKDIRFEEGRKINEDVFFVFQCFMKCHRVIYQDYTVYLCHITPNSASRSIFSEKYFDILYFADKKIKIINELYPQFRDQIPAIKMRANINLLILLRTTYNKKYRAQEKECLRTIRKLINSYTPANLLQKRIIFIVKYRLFWLYKLYLHLRLKFKKSR
ncbi:MAG: glycosyltransferase family 2 protein [Clostridia bacterium]|nr:glycosyltransferase family 2 protein [Clostridia bacterium]